MKWFEKAALIFVIVAIFVWVVAMIVAPDSFAGNLLNSGKVTEMARYLNEKYGYAVTQAHCVYFREEDYSYHSGFISGRQFHIPYIAIFEYNGKYITVTDRNGFLGDDNQLEEVNGLVCGYYERTLGIRPTYVEIGSGISYNTILFYHFNEKLDEDNIAEFLDCLKYSEDAVRLVFYFQREDDIDAQVEQIAQQLSTINTVSEAGFYISETAQLEQLYVPASVHGQEKSYNDDESDIGYICRYYHVVNDIEHHYPSYSVLAEAIKENHYYNNRYVIGGDAALSIGGSKGFGTREVIKIHKFDVVDLSDDLLDDYLLEMHSYGTFRGYTILMRTGEPEKLDRLVIADGDKYHWDFRWQDDAIGLYAFRYGKLWDLETLYDTGRLYPEDMDGILEKHKAYYEEQFGEKCD